MDSPIISDSAHFPLADHLVTDEDLHPDVLLSDLAEYQVYTDKKRRAVFVSHIKELFKVRYDAVSGGGGAGGSDVGTSNNAVVGSKGYSLGTSPQNGSSSVSGNKSLSSSNMSTGGMLDPSEALMELLGLIDVAAGFDDVALTVAQVLGQVINLAEGDVKVLVQLVTVFDTLCASPDAKVIIEASQAFGELIAANTDEDLFVQEVIPRVFGYARSLFAGQRSSAALLIHYCYEFISDPEEQYLVKELFRRLCADSDVIVRQHCLLTLPDWATLLGEDGAAFATGILLEMAKESDLDSIRVAVVQAVVKVGQAIKLGQQRTELSRIIIQLALDESWRVRFVIAQHLHALVVIFSNSVLSPSIVLLAQDEEKEVRAALAGQLGPICEGSVSTEVFAAYLEVALTLAQDDAASVRAAVANVICSVTAQANDEVAMRELFPVITRLLQESEPVKLTIIPTLWKLGSKILKDEEMSEELCKILSTAKTSKQWRLREATASTLRYLAPYASLGPYKQLLRECLRTLLVDPINGVRQAMFASLGTLCLQLDDEWCNTVLAMVLPYAAATNFRHRQCFTSCVEVLLPRVQAGTEDSYSDVTSALLKLANDPVSNVRIGLAHAMTNAHTVPPSVASTKQKVLELLRADSDSDVAQVASQSVELAPF